MSKAREGYSVSEYIFVLLIKILSTFQKLVNSLHLCRPFQTSGHSKPFTTLPHIHPFTHTFTHRRRSQPRRATASWSGAVRVRRLDIYTPYVCVHISHTTIGVNVCMTVCMNRWMRVRMGECVYDRVHEWVKGCMTMCVNGCMTV